MIPVKWSLLLSGHEVSAASLWVCDLMQIKAVKGQHKHSKDVYIWKFCSKHVLFSRTWLQESIHILSISRILKQMQKRFNIFFQMKFGKVVKNTFY